MKQARVLSLVALLGLAVACGNKKSAEQEAKEEAAEQDRLAEEAYKASGKTAPVTIRPPVAGGARIPCAQLVDTAGFTTALGEQAPVTVSEVTKNDAEAVASCDVVRGGKRLTDREQASLLKKQRRLGVLAGDAICNVTAYCWTIESDETFRTKCKGKGMEDNEDALGSFTCRQTVQQGADDVDSYLFFDADTRCVLKVHGGPSMIDNAVIARCAKAGRDLIGPTQIAVGAGK